MNDEFERELKGKMLFLAVSPEVRALPHDVVKMLLEIFESAARFGHRLGKKEGMVEAGEISQGLCAYSCGCEDPCTHYEAITKAAEAL